MNYVSIPKDRIGVLVGENGKTKKRIEKITNTKIDVDKEGEVCINGNDSLQVMKSLNIVKAISRGFNPVNAELLVEDDYILDMIELSGTPNFKERVRGRVIGKEGKMKKFLEESLDCKVSVFRDTVSIICKVEMVGIAREAVEMIIQGAPHDAVYGYIEDCLRKL